MLSSGTLIGRNSWRVTVKLWGAKGATLTKTKVTQRNRFTATEMGAFLPYYIFGIKGSNFHQEDITKQFLRLNWGIVACVCSYWEWRSCAIHGKMMEKTQNFENKTKLMESYNNLHQVILCKENKKRLGERAMIRSSGGRLTNNYWTLTDRVTWRPPYTQPHSTRRAW